MNKREIEVLAALGILVVGAWILHRGGKALAKGLNPASDQNWAYQGVNGVGSALTGDESFSLGGYLYDLTHPGQTDPTTPTPIPVGNANMGGYDFGVYSSDTGSWDSTLAGASSSSNDRTEYVTRNPPTTSYVDTKGGYSYK